MMAWLESISDMGGLGANAQNVELTRLPDWVRGHLNVQRFAMFCHVPLLTSVDQTRIPNRREYCSQSSPNRACPIGLTPSRIRVAGQGETRWCRP